MSTVGRGREEGAGGSCADSNVDTYITTCQTDGQRTFAVCLRERKQGLCDRLERWEGRGGDIRIPAADSC